MEINNIIPEGFKMTELGPLPKEWEVVRLGEILENRNIKYKNLVNNYKNPSVLSMTRGSGLIRQEYKFEKRVASKDLSNYKIVEKGNIVVGFPIDEGVISILFNLNYGVVSPTYEIWQFKRQDIDLYFFDALLKHKLMMNQYLKYMTRGVERRRIIKKNDFVNLFAPLPPLREQQKIAAVLSAVQTAKEKSEAVINAARELKKSMMKHLFTYGPVPPEETVNIPLKETEIGLVPEEWEVVRLGEVADIKSGGTPSREKREYWIGGNVPWIKSEQCQDCFIYTANEYITNLGLENSSAKLLKPNTVLMAMVGATMGKTGFLTIEACTNQNIAGIYPLRNLNNIYLYYVIQSRYKEFAKIRGYSIANLSYLKQFLIPIPPLPVQEKIASILSAFDSKIEAEENRKKALDDLFKSLLHNLMTSRIMVNQT